MNQNSQDAVVPHIRIRNIVKTFTERRSNKRSPLDADKGQEVRVLDNIDLEMENGEIVCILGPSGCGKTTLLRIVAGFDRQYQGQVYIANHRVDGPRPDHIFVFQHGGLLEWMTVRENVGLGLRHMKNREERKARIQEYIDMVDLTGFEDHYPHQLSGGMMRRVELARAMAVNPDVLFLDEPFTGLDFLTHMRMREEVLNLHEYIGKTIIMVTHDIDDALIMGDRLVIFSERPARIALSRKLDFPRPRDFARNMEMNELRDEVYLMLGVHHAL